MHNEISLPALSPTALDLNEIDVDEEASPAPAKVRESIQSLIRLLDQMAAGNSSMKATRRDGKSSVFIKAFEKDVQLLPPHANFQARSVHNKLARLRQGTVADRQLAIDFNATMVRAGRPSWNRSAQILQGLIDASALLNPQPPAEAPPKNEVIRQVANGNAHVDNAIRMTMTKKGRIKSSTDKNVSGVLSQADLLRRHSPDPEHAALLTRWDAFSENRGATQPPRSRERGHARTVDLAILASSARQAAQGHQEHAVYVSPPESAAPVRSHATLSPAIPGMGVRAQEQAVPSEAHTVDIDTREVMPSFRAASPPSGRRHAPALPGSPLGSGMRAATPSFDLPSLDWGRMPQLSPSLGRWPAIDLNEPSQGRPDFNTLPALSGAHFSLSSEPLPEVQSRRQPDFSPLPDRAQASSQWSLAGLEHASVRAASPSFDLPSLDEGRALQPSVSRSRRPAIDLNEASLGAPDFDALSILGGLELSMDNGQVEVTSRRPQPSVMSTSGQRAIDLNEPSQGRPDFDTLPALSGAYFSLRSEQPPEVQSRHMPDSTASPDRPQSSSRWSLAGLEHASTHAPSPSFDLPSLDEDRASAAVASWSRLPALHNAMSLPALPAASALSGRSVQGPAAPQHSLPRTPEGLLDSLGSLLEADHDWPSISFTDEAESAPMPGGPTQQPTFPDRAGVSLNPTASTMAVEPSRQTARKIIQDFVNRLNDMAENDVPITQKGSSGLSTSIRIAFENDGQLLPPQANASARWVHAQLDLLRRGTAPELQLALDFDAAMLRAGRPIWRQTAEIVDGLIAASELLRPKPPARIPPKHAVIDMVAGQRQNVAHAIKFGLTKNGMLRPDESNPDTSKVLAQINLLRHSPDHTDLWAQWETFSTQRRETLPLQHPGQNALRELRTLAHQVERMIPLLERMQRGESLAEVKRQFPSLRNNVDSYGVFTTLGATHLRQLYNSPDASHHRIAAGFEQASKLIVHNNREHLAEVFTDLAEAIRGLKTGQYTTKAAVLAPIKGRLDKADMYKYFNRTITVEGQLNQNPADNAALLAPLQWLRSSGVSAHAEAITAFEAAMRMPHHLLGTLPEQSLNPNSYRRPPRMPPSQQAQPTGNGRTPAAAREPLAERGEIPVPSAPSLAPSRTLNATAVQRTNATRDWVQGVVRQLPPAYQRILIGQAVDIELSLLAHSAPPLRHMLQSNDARLWNLVTEAQANTLRQINEFLHPGTA